MDIVAAGNKRDRMHFTGSVVWMQDGGIRPDGESLCLLIDGQQRLTSVSLLLIALAEHAREHPEGLEFSADMIIDRGYLVDKYSTGDVRYKLTLSGDDYDVLRGMTDRLVNPERPALSGTNSNLERNLGLFRKLVNAIGDANVVWNGLRRLEIVSVTLDQGRDEPQSVFESMNSTGLNLETSDLVRNYLLMGCPADEQTTLYEDYWRPMERRLRDVSFDSFLHDWMVVTLAQPVSKGRAMYQEFKRYAADSPSPRMLKDLESYLFRRMVCKVNSNGLNKLVPSLIGRLDDDASKDDDDHETNEIDPDESFAAMLLTQTAKSARIPTDDEFRRVLLGEDLYRTVSCCKHLLTGLENRNHPKDPRGFEDYTIEHIMPQNAMAHAEWHGMLEDPDRFPLLVNSLGNLTLTAYNSELSDGTFEEKKNRMAGGYDNEYLSISKEPREADQWDEQTIQLRGERLAMLTLEVWPLPEAGERALMEQRGHDRTAPSRKDNVIDLATLFRSGVLKSGDVLGSGYASVDAVAVVTDDGRLQLSNGETFSSPSGAFRRARELATGEDMQVNGWVAWRLPDGRTLDSLRQDTGTISARRTFWDGLYAYAATRPDFVEAYGNPSGRKPNESSWTSFGIGSIHCHADGSVSIRDGYIAVNLYFTNTSQYASLYGMKDWADGLLAALGTAEWDNLDANKKKRLLKVRHDVDFNADLTGSYQWMVDALLAMRRVHALLD